jgi:predicted PurR-regulated permease PerM
MAVKPQWPPAQELSRVPQSSRRQVLARVHPATRAVLLAALLLVVGLLFRQLVTLLLAVLITVIFAIWLDAIASRLERIGVPRVLGSVLALLASVGAVVGIVAALVPTFIHEVNQFVDQVPGMVTDLERRLHDAFGIKPGQVGTSVQHFIHSYTSKPSRLVGPVASVGIGVAGVLGALVLILLTSFYIAMRPQPLVDGVVSLFPLDLRGRVLEVMSRLRRAWLSWVGGVLASMVVLGVLFYVGLRIVGLDFALGFAVVSALAVVVPYFGALASGIPPILYALTYSPGKALAVFGVYVVAHEVEGNLVGPLIMARAVRLHPAVIAIGVVIMGDLFGALGLIVAVPILAGLFILVDELWVKPQESRKEVEVASG